jgi:hypothetical protein
MITLLLITNRFADGTQICLVTYMFLLCQHLDSNCIQVLAPENMEGLNSGRYEAGEHIGHLRKESSCKLAPILDKLIDADMVDSVSFDCYLRDNDTTHPRNGYYLHIVVRSSNSVDFNKKLLSLFIESDLLS